MPDSRAAELLDGLRAAARAGGERFLVACADAGARQRIAAALRAEGTVVEAASAREALDLPGAGPFEIVVTDLDEPAGGAWRQGVAAAHPAADAIALLEPDPGRCLVALEEGAAALLPRPLPENDALLRAHLRWLAAGRRARRQGLAVRAAASRGRTALRELEPALADALDDLLAEPVVASPPVVATVAAGGAEGGPPRGAEVVLVEARRQDDIAACLGAARARAPGAAVVLVDDGPSPARAGAFLYGGGRVYLPAAERARVPPLVAQVAARRRAELLGRRLLEALARHGVLERARPRAAAAADDEGRLLPSSQGPSAPVVPSGHDLLVVDDEVVVLSVLREALRRVGYRVTTATSAEEAIELLRTRPFDLVLTDKNLPGASGLEVLRVARALEPPPAVVLITGYSSYDSAVEAFDTGALDYIEKPIRDVEMLRARIRRALSRRDEQLARPQVLPGERRSRLLLVEVEGSRRRLMAEFLGRRYEVVAVSDGDEALRRLAGERFDLVLADRNLPGMSGLRVIEQAQRLLPHCASVLYTAYPAYETVKEAFDAGVDAYLVRPSDDLKSLAEKVEGALRSRGGILLG